MIDAGVAFKEPFEDFSISQHEMMELEQWELDALRELGDFPEQFAPYRIEVWYEAGPSARRIRIYYPVPDITSLP